MLPTSRLIVLGLLAMACAPVDSGPRGNGRPDPTTDTAVEGEGEPGCDDAARDCAGVCSGTATVDDCGVCDDDPGDDCLVTSTVTGGWICPIGVSCQDVYEVELAEGSAVSVDVDGIYGDSVIRLAVFAPDAALDGDNVLVGASRDLSCTGQNEAAATSFVADRAGTWRIAVGRDAGSSVGAAGSYTLTVGSPSGLASPLTGPSPDDAEPRSPGFRCGSEYVVDSSWACAVSESCQDVYTLDLPAGTALELSALALTGNSAVRFALHGPDVARGGPNLLTNTTNDRKCLGQEDDDVLAPYVTQQAGVYTVAITRDWGDSSGTRGDYRLVVGGDDFFDAPVATVDDEDSLAPGRQCAWTGSTSGAWSCGAGTSCQDVFDIALPAGARASTGVSGVTGDAVVQLAAFAPGEPLSGTNLLTGTNDDLACGLPNGAFDADPFEAPTTGVYRLAVGRDADDADMGGTYEARISVENGYGDTLVPTADDETSLSAGAVCP